MMPRDMKPSCFRQNAILDLNDLIRLPIASDARDDLHSAELSRIQNVRRVLIVVIPPKGGTAE